MRRWMKVSLAAAGAAAATTAALGAGSAAWERASRRAVEGLSLDEDAEAPPLPADHDALDALPAPAARYLRFAIPDGAAPVLRARIEHRGELRLAPDAAWSPFRSVQHVTTRPPGFVWDAAVDMMPLVGVRVRDSYVHGVGRMRASIGGLVTMADGRGPSIDAGSLQRWLAEAPWYPTALLPGRWVRWEPVDDSTARAVVTDGALRVSVELTVNARGELTRMYTPARLRDVDGVGVPTPWTATFRGWRPMDGLMIPTAGEVTWLLPDGPFTWWRGQVVDVAYETPRLEPMVAPASGPRRERAH